MEACDFGKHVQTQLCRFAARVALKSAFVIEQFAERLDPSDGTIRLVGEK